MAKTKQKKPTTQERLAALEERLYRVDQILSFYIEYNEDVKGFKRFLKEKIKQIQESSTKNQEESK